MSRTRRDEQLAAVNAAIPFSNGVQIEMNSSGSATVTLSFVLDRHAMASAAAVMADALRRGAIASEK